MFKLFKKKTIIPHVRLTGVIGNAGRFNKGMDLAGQQDILKKAFSIKKVKHVAISINSPGGSPVQSHLIYSYIRQLADKKKIKVLIFAEDVAASGGYLISCAGDEIYANSSSIIGSIGVISASFGFKELIKKMGIERRIYTAGKNKSTLDPFVDEKEEDIKRLKDIQLELHADFIKVVETSRGKKLKDPEKNNIFTGEFWTGASALKLGLIDGIGNADQILKEKFGEEAVIKKWILKFQKGREGRPSLRESNLPGTVADPIIEKIIGARIAALTSQELNQITYAHRLSMSAENILGLILEEYLAVNLDEHGWYCAWGGTVKHVDFVHEGGRLLQIKNRSNSENSASAGARDGTEIIKWFRIKAARIEYMWAALNEICGTNCLSEEDFVDFVQTTITNNPGCLGVEQNNPWS